MILKHQLHCFIQHFALTGYVVLLMKRNKTMFFIF